MRRTCCWGRKANSVSSTCIILKLFLPNYLFEQRGLFYFTNGSRWCRNMCTLNWTLNLTSNIRNNRKTEYSSTLTHLSDTKPRQLVPQFIFFQYVNKIIHTHKKGLVEKHQQNKKGKNTMELQGRTIWKQTNQGSMKEEEIRKQCLEIQNLGRAVVFKLKVSMQMGMLQNALSTCCKHPHFQSSCESQGRLHTMWGAEKEQVVESRQWMQNKPHD